MAFWLNESPLKTHLRLVSLRGRLLFSSLVLVIVTGTVYLKILRPKKLLIAGHETMLKSLEEKQETFFGSMGEYENLSAGRDELKQQHDNNLEQIINHEVCTDQLFDLIKQSHLICQTFAPTITSQDDTEIAMILNGSYSNLCIFFELIADKKLPMIVTKLVLEPYRDRQLRINISVKMGDL